MKLFIGAVCLTSEPGSLGENRSEDLLKDIENR